MASDLLRARRTIPSLLRSAVAIVAVTALVGTSPPALAAAPDAQADSVAWFKAHPDTFGTDVLVPGILSSLGVGTALTGVEMVAWGAVLGGVVAIGGGALLAVGGVVLLVRWSRAPERPEDPVRAAIDHTPGWQKLHPLTWWYRNPQSQWPVQPIDGPYAPASTGTNVSRNADTTGAVVVTAPSPATQNAGMHH